MFIQFISTGGTIDKIYFDDMSQFEVGESQIQHILSEGLVGFDFDILPLFRKDSLEMTDADRETLRTTIEAGVAERYVVTHGTDTMTETAAALRDIPGKVIVLTGALSPARFKTTDAIFNVGLAVGAAQLASPGVYIAMSGQIFRGDAVRKNRDANCFEPTTPGD